MRGRQYKLKLPRPGKSALLGLIRDRLYGDDLRQAAREAKRRQRALRKPKDIAASDPQYLLFETGFSPPQVMEIKCLTV